jgi:hypothetical protein
MPSIAIITADPTNSTVPVQTYLVIGIGRNIVDLRSLVSSLGMSTAIQASVLIRFTHISTWPLSFDHDSLPSKYASCSDISRLDETTTILHNAERAYVENVGS